MKETKEYIISYKQHMCSLCKRNSPNSYEALVQIRMKFFKDITAEKEEILEIIMKYEMDISRVEERELGFDIFLKDKNYMRGLGNDFKKKYQVCQAHTSKKLVGENKLESKKIYKLTLLINIFDISKGDYFKFRGKRVQVMNIKKNKVSFKDCKTSSKYIHNYTSLKDNFTKVLI